jgi:hypothetical protein
MKKIARIVALVMFVSVGVVGVVHASIFDEKRHSSCFTADGKFEPQRKDCDINSCGCFFHQIEELFKSIFK